MKTYNNSVVLRNDGIDPSTTNADLNAALGINITVRVASTPVAGLGALASIFDIAEVAIANPMQTDDKGNYQFKVTDGLYDIVIAEGTADEQILSSVEIFELQFIFQNGVIVFTTYAGLDAYTPADATEERASYKVTNDPTSSLNGYYHWTGGTSYIKDADLSNGVIEPNNPDATSGGTVYAARNIEQLLLGGTGKVVNELPFNSITNSFYQSNALVNEKGVLLPYNTFLAQAGISVGTNSGSFTMGDAKTGMTGKYLTMGVLLFSTDGQNVPTRGAGDWANTKGGANATLAYTDRDRIDLGNGLYVIWAKALVPAEYDTIVAEIDIRPNAGNYSVAAFISFTDIDIDVLDIDILGHQQIEQTGFLIDEIGAKKVEDYTGEMFPAHITAIKEITDIIPNGSTVKLAGADDLEVEFKFPSAVRYDFWHMSYYVYSDDHQIKAPRPFITLINGDLRVFPDLVTTLVSSERTWISDNIIRYDVSGQFTDEFLDGYGILAGHRFTATSNVNTYMFAYTAGLSTLRSKGQALHPTGWIPKKEPVNGYVLGDTAAIPSNWVGKKMVWLGTSISGGTRTFPEKTAEKLGIGELVNLAVGGGDIRGLDQDGGIPQESHLLFKFMYSIADSQTYFVPNIGQEVQPSRWEILQPGSGFVLTQTMIDDSLAMSYEARLAPHLDADFIVCEYGVNDRDGQAVSPWPLARDSGTNRGEFAGAYNALVEYIYANTTSTEPLPRIFMLTHHNRGVYNSVTWDLIESQLDIAKHWGFPIVNLADNLNLNPSTLTTWIPDGLHPTGGDQIDVAYTNQIVNQLQSKL